MQNRDREGVRAKAFFGSLPGRTISLGVGRQRIQAQKQIGRRSEVLRRYNSTVDRHRDHRAAAFPFERRCQAGEFNGLHLPSQFLLRSVGRRHGEKRAGGPAKEFVEFRQKLRQMYHHLQ